MRIDADVDEQLRVLAEQRGVSVNTLTARALARYIEWDAFGEKFGLSDMPSTIVQKMITTLSDDEISELGKWAGGTLLREQILFWFKEITPHSVLESYPRLASRYGRLFEYVERSEGGGHTIVIKHQGGPKLSVLYGEIIRTAFQELLTIRVEVEVSENQVVARFATPPSMPHTASRPGGSSAGPGPAKPREQPVLGGEVQ